MNILYFADIMEDGRVRACLSCEEPDVGPPIAQNAEGTPKLIDDPINWAGPSATSVLYWNEDNGFHWVETASVESLKVKKNEEINSIRESLNSDTFTYQGKAIRCRPLDRSDIDGTNGYVALFGEFPQGWAGGWKAADNSYVQIATVDDWKEFYKAMVDTGNANFRYAQQLKARLAVAETHEQVAAIKWEKADA